MKDGVVRQMNGMAMSPRRDAPYFSNQVVNVIPSDRGVCYPSPPSQKVSRADVCVCMEVVRDRYLVVLEGRRNEAYMELGG